ncbi:TIGR00730 family Rossman fold protein [Zhouia sp. PK063]|uniref:TIGR00730 family Rossman fold protein n=1 Tax=Zhouia sp. PK063 TaxID=3373602 RepID=UPI003797A3E1
MKSIAIYCGSSSGNNPVYETEAFQLGVTLAKENMIVIYGGAKVGLMGAVANGALSINGKVIGVLPEFLQTKEIAHTQLTELHIVTTMHERKLKMNELCEGVITLPGGFGTMEELFEMITWAQLGLHQKPIGILNIDGYYNALIVLLDDMVKNGLLKEVNRKMLLVSNNIDDLLHQMKNYQAPVVSKWITKDNT